MFVAHAVFDLFSVELPQQEGAAGASPPDKALDTVVEHLVVETETADVLLCLISLPHTALQDGRLVQLTVVMSHRADGVKSVRLTDIWQVFCAKALRAVRDCQRVVGMALRQHQKILPRSLGDVAPGLHNGDRKLLPKPPQQRHAHDAHEGCVAGGAALALLDVRCHDNALVELIVTGGTERHQIVRSVTAYPAALKMMHMEPHLFLLGRVRSAALAGIAVTPQNILAHVVVAVHLALLVVLALRNRLPFRNGLEELQVELGGLHNHLADRQDGAGTPDGGHVLLNLDLHGGRKPAFVLAPHAIVEAWLAIPGGTIAPRTAELPACGHQLDYIVARLDLCGEQFLRFGGS